MNPENKNDFVKEKTIKFFIMELATGIEPATYWLPYYYRFPCHAIQICMFV